MRLFLLTVLLTTLTVGYSQCMVTKWYNGKKAALSISFEGNDNSIYEFGANSLKKRGFISTYFVSTKTAKWEQISKVRKQGHFIGNHSHSNVNLTKLDSLGIENELQTSISLLKKKFPEDTILSFSYPFGVGLKPGKKYDSIRTIINSYHLCSTAPGLSGRYLSSNFEIPYHGYKNKDYDHFYHQLGSMVINDKISIDEFVIKVDKTIDNGNWLSLMCYSIGSVGREHVSEQLFSQVLDSIYSKKESLWVAPIEELVMYHKMRRNIQFEYLELDDYNVQVVLKDNLDNNVYDHELTVQVMKPIDMVAVKVLQSGKKCEFSQDWKILQFNARPDLGPVNITYKPVDVE